MAFVLCLSSTGASAQDSVVAESIGERSTSPPVADGSVPGGSGPARYTTGSVNGLYYQIGTVEDLEVRVALQKSRDLEATVLVVNSSDRSLTFRPSEIRVQGKRKGAESRLRVFSAEEWEKKRRSDYAADGGSGGASPASSERPPAGTSSQGGATRILYGDPCGGVTGGTDSAAVSIWSTRQDCVQSPRGTSSKLGASARQRRAAASEAEIANLARTQTLLPGSSYRGTVHIKKKKADQYRVTVPFGGETFSFLFEFE